MRIAAILIAAALLAGCANRPSAADDPTASCFASSMNSVLLDVLQPKVGSTSSLDGVTLAMLSDPSFPSDEERRALEVWVSKREQCVRVGRTFREKYAPPFYTAGLESSQQAMTELTERLYSKKISYGEFNTQRRRLASADRQNIANRAEQEQAAAQQRKTQALLEYQRSLEQQQMIQQQNRPITTNCNRMGTYTNCTTQ